MKNCGTCRYWGSDVAPFRQCECPIPPLPMWAILGSGDHGDWTEATDGARCPTWEQREPAR